MANSIYANARAKALESTLIDSDRLKRMIECENVDDAIKILAEINFGEGGVQTRDDFETLILLEQRKLNDFILNNCASNSFKNFMLYRNDFLNAEGLIKAKYLKVDSSSLTGEKGTFEVDKLKEIIMTDDYKNLPKTLADALLKCDEEFVSNRATGSSIGSIIHKALYNELLNQAKKDKNILTIFKAQADGINSCSALRCRDFNAVKEFFIEGGNLTLMDVKSLSEDSFDQLLTRFKFFENKEIILSAIESAEKNMPLSTAEKLIESFPLKFLSKQKYQTEGIIPFILYCYYKLADLQNIRIILVGIKNKFSKDDIKSRLRDCYAG